jgi:hypothetical protein
LRALVGLGARLLAMRVALLPASAADDHDQQAGEKQSVQAGGVDAAGAVADPRQRS